MSESEENYRKLQQHLDTMPIGYPATKSGVEIKLLKQFFSPKEAGIATKLSLDFEPLEKIYERFKDSGISIDELEQHLDNMVKNGGLEFKKEGNIKYYANALFAVGMYEHKLKSIDKEFIEDFMRYGVEAFGQELYRTEIPQLRVIPLEESIKHENIVANYDDLRKLIKNSDGPFSVQECICRNGRELYGQHCKVTSRKETCVGIGHNAQLYIDQGWAREVNKDELLEILLQNEKDGLIIQPSNSLNPEFICSCCGCCCGIISTLLMYPKPRMYVASNHYAEVNSDLCTGCETCIDRCQMSAIKIIEGISTIDFDRCIGCGNCVTSCPEGAIELKMVENEIIPPKTKEELHEKIMERKKQVIKEEEEKKERRRKRREERKKQK